MVIALVYTTDGQFVVFCLCFLVCHFCMQHNLNSYEQILMKFLIEVEVIRFW